MEYRRLGRSGLKVSEICLGTATFGDVTDEAAARSIVDAAIDAGVNFIDTANVYNNGVAETMLGAILKNRRADLVISTKFSNPTGTGPNDSGGSRVHILRAVEDSLRRLQSDYIDLYYVHHTATEAPIEETLSTLDTLIRQGKVRYPACSNHEAGRLLESLWVSDTNGFQRFVAYEPLYNLLQRDIEDEIVPVCELKGIGIVAWGALAGGLLSGKYAPDQTSLPGTRSDNPKLFRNRLPLYSPARAEIIRTLQAVSAHLGRPPSTVALSWLIARPMVASVIIGARSLAQARENFGAAGWTLPEEVRQRLDAVSEPAPRYPKAFEAMRARARGTPLATPR